MLRNFCMHRAIVIFAIITAFCLATADGQESERNLQKPARSGKPRILEVDKDLCMGGLPFFAPTFKIEGSEIIFSGGDYRNTILDFSKAETEALVFASILSDLGCWDSGDKKNYTVGILLDEDDRTMFIDKNWVYFPGKLRKVEKDGPFASIHMRCVKGGQGVKGVGLEVNGILVQTDAEGWAFVELKNIESKLLSLKITSPQHPVPVVKKIAVPFVCARPGLIHYKTITVDISQIF